MRLFTQPKRPEANRTQIPQVRVGVAHVVGPAVFTVDASHLVFSSDGTRQVRMDVEELKLIIAYGQVDLSTDAMRLLRSHGIGMSWLNESGTALMGSLDDQSSSRILSRLMQYQVWNDQSWQLTAARKIVMAKLRATQSALRHYQRQRHKLSDGTLVEFERAIDACELTPSLDVLRGIEGNAAARWYSEYARFFSHTFSFKTRNRRPPRDPVNSLLSLGYMQLYRRVVARIESEGLEPALGMLHEFRAGRMSLACDLMEPLRIPVVDRWVLALCQQGIVKLDDFDLGPDGKGTEKGVFLKKDRLGKVLGRFEEHWHQDMFIHILDDMVFDFRNSLDDGIGADTRKMNSYTKLRLLREHKGSGDHDGGDF
jgi:CRISP-associated protein Cas1